MLERDRKGRISNELVAASCAAILTVYASGYWRTRDEDRRFVNEAQTRRPARQVATSSVPVPVPVLPADLPATDVVQGLKAPQPAAKEALPAPAAPSSAASVVPAVSDIPVLASAAVEQEAAPQVEAEVAAEEAEAAPSHKPWIDGYYTGWGQSRHGDIQSFVTIKDGMIVNAGIATCETRYPCSVISTILLQPIDLQGPDVDTVSRATESADAYYYGLVKALENAETGTFRSTQTVIRKMAAMGTVVSIEVDAPEAAVMRAFEWFRQVEAVCSRFDAGSELRRLPVGEPTPATPILYEAVSFALKVAQETDGAFDPTLGSRMAARGYNRHYATRVATDAPGTQGASFRDVVLDAGDQTILLKRRIDAGPGCRRQGSGR